MWFVLFLLFVFFSVPLLEQYLPIALFVFGVYYLLNYKITTELGKTKPNALDVIVENKIWKNIIFVYVFLALMAAFYFLAVGKDLGEYIDNFPKLLLLFIAPLLGPIAVSQYRVYRNLGENNA